MHMLLLQQPEGQVLLLQRKESLQTPPVQVSQFPHDQQGCPAVPQAKSAVPVLQVVPSQQPARQVEAEQPAWQLPALQLVPLLQTLQVAPPTPQVASRWPGLHLSASQQPTHDVAVQAHLPATQAWVELQPAQAPPAMPQAAPVLPGRHWPWLSQQPVEQLVALQVPVEPWHEPALQTSLSWQVLQA